MGNNNSRTQNTAKNILWGYIGNIVSLILQFASRTVFIYSIGVSYLGVNGLFSSVLGLLSLSELGIGTAINYNLYKPVADGDKEKIKSLMHLYKIAYRVIALIITVIGIVLIPFLPYIIKEANEIPNITLYYLIFLFNTVSSYFVSYKYGLVNAEQKGYIINNFNSIATAIITIAQMMVLILFKNYLVFLIIQAVLQLCQKIGIGIFLNKRYAYLQDKNVSKLEDHEYQKIKKDVFALILHKLGDVCVNQTDSIIISSFISVTIVGLVSNYKLVITSVLGFVNIIFNSVAASIGNLVATENKERQEEIFDIYNFVGFWIYGFSCCCFFALFQPFISLWIGADKRIDNLSLILIVIDQYIVGQRIVINNMKVAGGIFEQDKYVALIQAVVNLFVSLLCVKLLGLPGIYLGTIIAGMVPFIFKPIVMYKYMFSKSAYKYFWKNLWYGLVVLITSLVAYELVMRIISTLTWGRFILATFLCTIITNGIFAIVYCRSVEFKQVWSRMMAMIKRRI